MKVDKDDSVAFVGTVTIHLVLLIILYFAVLRTIVPTEDSGIFVNFGDFSASMGAREPAYAASTQQKEIPPQPTPKPVPVAEEKLITQDTEKTAAIPEKKEKKDQTVADEQAKREKEEAERRRQEEEKRRKEEEERRRQQEAISNRLSDAFGMGSSEDTQQGDATTGAGNQGSPFGNSDTGANEGVGGYGTFNLNGRSIGSGGLPRPTYNGEDEGRIVINITVDPKGNVISADIGRGTNIDNASLRKSAIDAAKRAKFNKIQGTNNQNGTITYIYKYL